MMQQRVDSLQHELQLLFNDAKLPTSPTVAVRVLSLIDDPLSTAVQFGQLIEADPALSLRLLKLANEGRYNRGAPVSTIQRAVTLIGLRQLRLLVLGFELVRHLGRLGDCSFDTDDFWQESLLRACLSREIAASVVPSLEEEAFLVGLLQDCGIPLLVQVLGPEYAALFEDHRGSPLVFHAGENRFFPYTHTDAIQVLSTMWNLPDCIRAPLEMQHTRPEIVEEPTAAQKLGLVSYFAGSVGFFAVDRSATEETRLLGFAGEVLHLTQEDLERSLEASEEAFRSFTALFEDTLPEDYDIIDLLAEAKRKLADEAANLERDLESMQQGVMQLEAERSTLATSLARYREQASIDPLTGALNRGALVESTDHCIRMAKELEMPLAALFVDIDDFKSINDEFGHVVGDEVLKGIASSIMQTAGDAIVGRFGGEEFVVVVPGLTAEQAEDLGRQVLVGIRDLPFDESGLLRPVTCSLGVAWVAPRTARSPQSVFAAADELMYAAKRSGKDCLRFGVFNPEVSEHSKSAAEVPDAAPAQNQSHPPTLFAGVSIEDLERVAAALQRNVHTSKLNQRKHERQTLLTPCTLSCFVDQSLRVRREKALARNISAGGLAILTGQRLVRGDLVEVEIGRSSGRIFLAGCVAYCKSVEGTIHDVGIQLAQQADSPIFAENPVLAIRNHEWIARAVKERFGRWPDLRASA